MPRLIAALLLIAATSASSGCLVLSLSPAYDEATLGWEPNLIGIWESSDDKATIQIDRGEWKSYRIHYVHPIETGDLTGYLTMIGNDRYLDVAPVRGVDPGSFLIPVHALLRVRLGGDRLDLTPLSYDWFADQLRSARAIQPLSVVLDQKQNALIVSPADRLRDWVRLQSVDAPAFGASASFTRKRGDR